MILIRAGRRCSRRGIESAKRLPLRFAFRMDRLRMMTRGAVSTTAFTFGLWLYDRSGAGMEILRRLYFKKLWAGLVVTWVWTAIWLASSAPWAGILFAAFLVFWIVVVVMVARAPVILSEYEEVKK